MASRVGGLAEAQDLFAPAEVGAAVPRSEYKKRVAELRQELLEAQSRLRAADFPVIVMFAGVDGAGKGELANLLSEWMDPRGLVTRAFGSPSEEERERPPSWRFWRDLPPRGNIGIFLSAWYTKPLLDRVYGESTDLELAARLEEIDAFEKTLADDGYLFVKFWMHLGREAQRTRFETLEADPLNRWRVTRKDWEHWTMYDRFIRSSARIIEHTGTDQAPWTIVEGADANYRSLETGRVLRDRIVERLDRWELTTDETGPVAAGDGAGATAARAAAPGVKGSSPAAAIRPVTVLSSLDLTRSLAKREYRTEVSRLQAHLNRLHRVARARRRSTILVFEGWDAAGKGGAIRRITRALDARDYQIISIAGPTDEEKAHHYLWRFWRHLPRAGRFLIFDRSWYGRVLVERVEGFATDDEWLRAYEEINDFERQLVDHGTVLVKFWLHIAQDEQEARFRARLETPYKRWKLTDEDWRNRERWRAYEIAVDDMVRLTGTALAPWTLVEANDKRYARVRVLDTVCEALDRALGRPLNDMNGIQLA
jgi:polyphosphate:AMP phosphotransferase